MVNYLRPLCMYCISINETDIVLYCQQEFQKENFQAKIFGYSLRSCFGTFAITLVNFFRISCVLHKIYLLTLIFCIQDWATYLKHNGMPDNGGVIPMACMKHILNHVGTLSESLMPCWNFCWISLAFLKINWLRKWTVHINRAYEKNLSRFGTFAKSLISFVQIIFQL